VRVKQDTYLEKQKRVFCFFSPECSRKITGKMLALNTSELWYSPPSNASLFIGVKCCGGYEVFDSNGLKDIFPFDAFICITLSNGKWPHKP